MSHPKVDISWTVFSNLGCSRDSKTSFSLHEQVMQTAAMFFPFPRYKSINHDNFSLQVSKVAGQVQTVCAAAFDVEFEDVEGKCPSLGGPFSRLHALKSELQKGKCSAWIFCTLLLFRRSRYFMLSLGSVLNAEMYSLCQKYAGYFVPSLCIRFGCVVQFPWYS